MITPTDSILIEIHYFDFMRRERPTHSLKHIFVKAWKYWRSNFQAKRHSMNDKSKELEIFRDVLKKRPQTPQHKSSPKMFIRGSHSCQMTSHEEPTARFHGRGPSGCDAQLHANRKTYFHRGKVADMMNVTVTGDEGNNAACSGWLMTKLSNYHVEKNWRRWF